MREVKNRLRKDYRDKLSEFTTDKNRVQQNRRRLLKHLSSLNFWGSRPLTAGYQALKGEPCLESFYQTQPDSFAFPVLTGGGGEMAFYLPQPPFSWKKGAFSIPEPDPADSRKALPGEIEVFLVPGRAFDRRGGRLGRGLACYDKYLAQTKACKVGVAWSFQIHGEDLPMEEHDILMDFIVTDQFVLRPDIRKTETLNFNKNKKELAHNG